jgi:uncharacterized protein with PQ loop repeat
MLELIYTSGQCTIDSILGYIVGPLLCLGSICSYIPQYYIIIKNKTVGEINEFSLILLNIGNFCLSLNSIILNWSKWGCFKVCGFWLCMAHLLPFYQILMGWIMVFIFYMLFMKYKIRNRENKLFAVIFYGLMYLGFIAIVIAIAVGEKVWNSGPDQISFFNVFAQVLGYASAVFNCIAWLPQIYTLFKIKQSKNLSPWMFALQTPGNIIIIVFQAVLFKQPVSTWITYLITCIEQTLILVIIIVYYIRDRRHQESLEFVEEWRLSHDDEMDNFI